MSKLDILQLGDRRLHEMCTPVDTSASSTRTLVRDLADTSVATRCLDGILATQRAIDATAFCTRAEWQRQYRR
ncbi:MAG TPA: hypothetical protein VL400_17830 [Polyangiaceae bacterium]|jgi:peptide deformylase|nr:hypothetical protein [Polyangiaceae bacterium]